MSASEHCFCRAYLSDVMTDVRKQFSPEEVKEASVYVSRGLGTNPNGEFWGPGQEYFHIGSCCCAWEAKAKGWEKMMKKRGEKLERGKRG